MRGLTTKDIVLYTPFGNLILVEIDVSIATVSGSGVLKGLGADMNSSSHFVDGLNIVDG